MMSVQRIRQNPNITYSRNYKKVRIEFKDGTHMIGWINIHAKFKSSAQKDDPSVAIKDSEFKFSRTSDYLKDCNSNEGVITVGAAMYGDREIDACFVFLHSVKFITEE
jgi:hypothetical protein